MIIIYIIFLVEEPCELGCDGLNYCTNFNNRPTELFRSCTPQADEAARYDFALWQQQGILQLPGIQLPVKNISQCSPHAWKAIACTLQTKPCHSATHASRICKEDCFEILSECVDRERLPPSLSPAALCARLSPDAPPDAPCISLKPFLEPSQWRIDKESMKPGEQVTAPCRGEPCNTSEVCGVNRNCAPGKSCLPYTCTPGNNLFIRNDFKVMFQLKSFFFKENLKKCNNKYKSNGCIVIIVMNT